ncbi:hypothetical protein QVD99_007081 [Batrachochytrium dendrobatidis]|nr:hypothetical protein O5D80_007644 [Batrachochytrium dendrobatidis]KAK5666323.1 hypothetical protein QVD99_007081 [Batrachochytrium dendrobatidis]
MSESNHNSQTDKPTHSFRNNRISLSKEQSWRKPHFQDESVEQPSLSLNSAAKCRSDTHSLSASSKDTTRNTHSLSGSWRKTTKDTLNKSSIQSMSSEGLRQTIRNFDSPVASSSLDSLSFVSRNSNDDGRPSLCDLKVQEDYFQLILEKIGKDITIAPDTSHIILSLRKLREGIVATSRCDAFAIRVYEQSALACLDTKNNAELFKSLVYLVNTLYPVISTSIEVSDSSSNLASTNRSEMSGYLLLLLVCEIPKTKWSTTPSHSSSVQIARQTRYGDSSEILGILYSLPHSIRQSKPVQFTMRVYTALVRDIDYVLLSNLWDTATCHQRMLLSNALPTIQARTMTILAKAYFKFPAKLLMKYLCLNHHNNADSDPILLEKLNVLLPTRFDAVVDGMVPLRFKK